VFDNFSKLLTGVDTSMIGSLTSLINSGQASDALNLISLSTGLSDEIVTRTSQDTSLTSSITTLSTSTSTGVTSLSTGLSTEISIRASQTTSLISNISTLSTSNSTINSVQTSLITSLSTSSSTINSSQTSQLTSLSTSTSTTASSLSTGLSTHVSTGVSLTNSLTSSITTLSTSTATAVTSLTTINSTQTSQVTSLSTSTATAVTSLTTINSTQTSQVTSLSTSTATAVTSLTTINSTQTSQVTSLSTSCSTTNSTQTSLITSLSTSTSTINLEQTSLITSLSTSSSTINLEQTSLITSLSTSTSTINLEQTSLITSLSTSTATAVTSLTTINSTQTSQVTSLSTSTSTFLFTLSTSTSTAFVRLSTAESNITSTATAITSLTTINSTQTSQVISLSTSTSTINSTQTSQVISLSTSTSTINVSLTKMNNTSIVPTKVNLNSKTLNNSANPIPISKYPVQENIINLNGWYYTTTYKGGINWSIYPIGTDGTTKLKLQNINQLYYTVNINKPTPRNLIPQLYITWGASSYSTFNATITGVTYPLPAGTYTFVLNFNTLVSNSNIVNTDYNNMTGRIINLSFDSTNSNPNLIATIQSNLTNTITNIQLITPTAFSSSNYTLIGSSAGIIRYSTDSINYTNTVTGENLVSSINGIGAFIVSNSLTWIAYGAFNSGGNCIAYSTSGITNGFTNIPSIFAGTNVIGSINSIDYNNAYNSSTGLMLLAGGSITSGGSVGLAPLAYSTNVSNWAQFSGTNSPFTSTDVINSITYNYNANIWLFGLNSRTGGTLVTAINNFGTTFTFTSDTAASAILDSYIMAIVSNLTNNFFVAVGKGSGASANNRIMTSLTGNLGSWSVVSSNLFTDTTDVENNGTIWLISGSGTNSLAYSLNGTTWIGLLKNTVTNPFNSITKIKWSGTTWIACGLGATSAPVLAYSYSGITWTTISTVTTITTSLGCLYPQVYQFLLSNLYVENSRDTNISPGTIQYNFDSADVDNNYQYNVMNTLIQNLYKMDLYTYSDPLTITTL
jgi:hypothetical protein